MSLSKPDWRALLRQRRRALSPASRALASSRVVDHARHQPWLRRGRHIGLYWPHASELNVLPLLLLAQQAGCICYLPQVPARGRGKLWFAALDQTVSWRRNRYGIPEPRTPIRRRATQLDVLFLPLLGIDAQGYRLGAGGGYYDTSLAARRQRRSYRRPLLLGVGYECQRVAELPHDPWDLRLDGILTEAGVAWF